MQSYEYYKNELEKILSSKRFNHSVNVSLMAEKLAKNYGVDSEKAKLAGLLHDICKEKPDEENIEISKKNGYFGSSDKINSVKILHGPAASFFLKEKYGITDNEILNAVRYHTTGRKNMTLFEKIIFTADYISSERDWPDVKEFQKVAFENIDKVVLKKLSTAIQNCLDRHQSICENTMQLYNELILEGV